MNPDQTAWETGSTQDWPGQGFIQKISSGITSEKFGSRSGRAVYWA